jgi:uncharacterized protein (DUF305 family)
MQHTIHRVLRSSSVLLCLCWLAACGQRNIGPPPTPTSPASENATMPTSSVPDTPPSSSYNMTFLVEEHPDVPYDALFLDRMLIHSLSVIDAASQAADLATQPELRAMAELMQETQESRLTQFQQWRSEWYPDTGNTTGAGMGMQSLVIEEPDDAYDLRFIEAMLPHYVGMVALAEDAQRNAEHAELRELAGEIVTSGQARIERMQDWQQQLSGGE